ncbi:hypothetical protein [Streptomyces sp. NPDC001658]
MTALAVPVPAGGTPSGGTGRAVRRPHRVALVVWGLAVTAAAVYLVWLHSLAYEARGGTSACAVPPADGLPSCASVAAITADDVYGGGISLVAGALARLVLPVAAWAGAALVARELETGTARFAWTQGVSPTRWLAARLAVPAALLTAGTGTLVLLHVWARGDGDPNLVGDWYHPDVFIATGPACVAYALAALALGALIGLLVRRTLPAAGLTFAACLVLHNVMTRFREDLWPTVTRTGGGELPRSAFTVAWSERFAAFHPRSHYWPLQFMETGLLLTVTAVATTAAFRLLRRRTA